jgi:hypothetical protein
MIAAKTKRAGRFTIKDYTVCISISLHYFKLHFAKLIACRAYFNVFWALIPMSQGPKIEVPNGQNPFHPDP